MPPTLAQADDCAIHRYSQSSIGGEDGEIPFSIVEYEEFADGKIGVGHIGLVEYGVEAIAYFVGVCAVGIVGGF